MLRHLPKEMVRTIGLRRRWDLGHPAADASADRQFAARGAPRMEVPVGRVAVVIADGALELSVAWRGHGHDVGRCVG